MTDVPEPAVLLSVLLSRLDNHIETARAASAALRWWEVRKRLILRGAISAYLIEHAAALELGGAYAMSQFQRG